MVGINRVLGGAIAIPVALLTGVRALPQIADNTAAMARAVAALPRIEREITLVAQAAAVLPGIEERLTTIEGAMPALVEVQSSLADLPETMSGLDGGLVRLMTTVDQLVAAVGPLQETAVSVGRIVRRLPGGGRDARP